MLRVRKILNYCYLSEIKALSNEILVNNVAKYFYRYDGKGREITTELHLTNLTYDDAGRYQCVVSNKFGVTYSEKANITVYVYPTFVVTPENITVESGSQATLRCAAQGVPAPKLLWTKDFGANKFPAAEERRINRPSFQPSDDRNTNINSIVIRNVKAVDSGEYTCTAKNPAGLISWNITLSVLEMPRYVIHILFWILYFHDFIFS